MKELNINEEDDSRSDINLTTPPLFNHFYSK